MARFQGVGNGMREKSRKGGSAKGVWCGVGAGFACVVALLCSLCPVQCGAACLGGQAAGAGCCAVQQFAWQK